MKYLMLKTKNKEDYIELKPHQEEKIERLYAEGRMPKTFILNGVTINKDEILGFTDDRPQEQLGITNFNDLKTWVHKQSWYRHTSSSSA